MKKVITLVLIIALLALAACGAPDPAPIPTPEPTPVPTPEPTSSGTGVRYFDFTRDEYIEYVSPLMEDAGFTPLKMMAVFPNDATSDVWGEAIGYTSFLDGGGGITLTETTAGDLVTISFCAFPNTVTSFACFDKLIDITLEYLEGENSQEVAEKLNVRNKWTTAGTSDVANCAYMYIVKDGGQLLSIIAF